TGSLVPPLAAADLDRLARHDAGDRVALVHAVRVHDPGHDLRVGPEVRRRDVHGRADDDGNFGSVATGEALQFAHAELVRVDDNAALRASIRQVHHGTLPGHPHRQRAYFVEADVWAVADAALHRAAGFVVLDAEAREHPRRAVIHAHREVRGQLPLGVGEDLDHALWQAEHAADA